MSEQTEEQKAEAEAEAQENDTSGFVIESGGPQKPAETAQEAEAGDGEAEGGKGEEKPQKPAAAAQETEEGEEGAEEGEEQREGLPPGVIKRLQRLRRREQRERARADALEAQLRERGEEPPDREEPQAQDFDKWEDYQKALDEWQGSKKGKGKEPDLAKVAEATGKAEKARHVATLHETLSAEAPEIWDVLAGEDAPEVDWAITDEMIAAWAESDDPAAIGRYLVDHLDETFEIAGMTPRQIERKFLKIELGAGREPAKAAGPEKPEKAEDKPRRRQSRAPDPIETGGQRRAAEMTAEEAAEKGDFATFEKLRAKDEEASVGGW